MSSHASSLQHGQSCGMGSSLFDNRTRLMTVNELANRLHLSRASIYRLMSEEELPRLKVGRAVRFRWEEVERWLSRRSQP